MTKTEIENRATEIENSVAQSEAMVYQQINQFDRTLSNLWNATSLLKDTLKKTIDDHRKNEREKLKAYEAEAKDLRKELKKLKNRENKPKRTWPITNYTIARKIGISETQLIVRLMKLGVMHKDWGSLEVYSDWKNFVRLVSMPTAKNKHRNVWQWTPEGRDKFMEIHNKTNF